MNDIEKQHSERNIDDWTLGGIAGLASVPLAWWGCVEAQLHLAGIGGHKGLAQLKTGIHDAINHNFYENVKGHTIELEDMTRSQNAMRGERILQGLPQLEQPNNTSKLLIVGTLVATTFLVSGWLAEQRQEKENNIIPQTNLKANTAIAQPAFPSADQHLQKTQKK
jgi:hypothetical protein